MLDREKVATRNSPEKRESQFGREAPREWFRMSAQVYVTNAADRALVAIGPLLCVLRFCCTDFGDSPWSGIDAARRAS